MYWLITNRNVEANGFGGDFSPVTYWTAPATANPTLKASWTQVTKDQFRQQLVTVADQFPSPLVTAPKDQNVENVLAPKSVTPDLSSPAPVQAGQ